MAGKCLHGPKGNNINLRKEINWNSDIVLSQSWAAEFSPKRLSRLGGELTLERRSSFQRKEETEDKYKRGLEGFSDTRFLWHLDTVPAKLAKEQGLLSLWESLPAVLGSFQPGFLSLGITGVWNWIVLCCGGCPVCCRVLPASLSSTNWRPIVPPPSYGNKSISRDCWISPGGQNFPRLQGTALSRYLFRSKSPGLGRRPEGGNGNPLRFSCLQNSMDRGAWRAISHRVAKSWTWLKQFSTHTYIYIYTLTYMCTCICTNHRRNSL